MKYTITPGIAAFVTVNSEAFPVEYGERNQDYVYINETNPIQNTNPNGIAFDVLPEMLQKQLTQHFDAIFAMSPSSRKGYLEQLVPITIDM